MENVLRIIKFVNNVFNVRKVLHLIKGRLDIIRTKNLHTNAIHIKKLNKKECNMISQRKVYSLCFSKNGDGNCAADYQVC